MSEVQTTHQALSTRVSSTRNTHYPAMVVTLVTFQSPMFWLKSRVNANMPSRV